MFNVLRSLKFSVLMSAGLASFQLGIPTANADGVCGQNFESYVVVQGGWNPNPTVRGIRCVRLNPSAASVGGTPIVWYGEGQWPGQEVYRHLGYGRMLNSNTYMVSMADFANYNNPDPTYRDYRSHQLTLTAVTGFGYQPGTISQYILRGTDINETWYRSDQYFGYHPSGLSNSCGRNFQEYTVANFGAGVDSLRCLLRTRDGALIWYGEGSWSGRTYKHIGYLGGNQWRVGTGLFDLCTPGTSFCAPGYQRDFGNVQLTYEPCYGNAHVPYPEYNACAVMSAQDMQEHWVPASWVQHRFNPIQFGPGQPPVVVTPPTNPVYPQPGRPVIVRPQFAQ